MVTLTVLTGGVRCGKSAAAVAAAATSGAPVTYIATAEPGDDEMAERIQRHRAERPAHWTTLEEPRDLATAVASVDLDATLVIDCLGMWVTNRLLEDPPPASAAVVEEAAGLAGELAARPGLTLVVTNEVGSGVVPATPLGREFRDLLGSVNQAMVRAADAAYLVVAGRLLPLVDPADGLGPTGRGE
ncbi:MAG: bifunctional adenosylcobinamide kinase/adenosylcobinamide-phosphate guanylyltransferase [Acidimicrobiaceae bacterium]|nr:bifunctional adenosylcobinamide kinase/adenosylcobinamide-phosphate guanylyltransferase [Acidimicrobiaceae bacterium]MXZ52748.1 bifunctional adenosylcobinamide kinase/adenosylcobinamide-phosphate guanylyltransferase [Acidimicrobiaceae bacterium]MYA86040.1 bifunctional adenosylcobinamide kinase/adenosylcobinamide-phosphate guanylyltransferase [Acidimicrobiaceae bacterium]MYH78240.1 bifunctional adenosylcobinamide kinase/adenosylcobinamide-phosphate guanylyltransferase [Acidimicrobiaceae bacter